MTKRRSLQSPNGLPRFIYVLSLTGALVFLYLQAFLLPHTPFVGVNDQTLFFFRALRIVRGEVLYRDFFELVTPGTDLLYAAGFRLFGVHAWVLQAWGIALGMAFVCVITRIAASILKGPMILLPALLFLAFDFSHAYELTHHWYSTLATLAAVSALIAGVNLRRIFTAGIFCGLATLFTQTQGALTFIAVVLYLIWLNRAEADNFSLLKRLAALALPFVAVLSSVLGYYIHKAGFHNVFFDLVEFPIRHIYLPSINGNSPHAHIRQFPHVHLSAAAAVRLIPYVFIYALVPYIYFIGFFQLWRKRDPISEAVRQNLVLLLLVGLALFLAVANGPSFFRRSTIAPPAILICVWLLSHQSAALRVARGLLGALAIVFALIETAHHQTQWHATLNLPIGQTAFNDISTFREFQWLAQRTHPSDTFFNSSVHCLYLSLDNPTASEFVTYDDFTRPYQVNAIIQSLQRHPAHFIFLLPKSEDPSDVHDNAAPFRQYVRSHYKLVQTFYVGLGDVLYEHEFWELNP